MNLISNLIQKLFPDAQVVKRTENDELFEISFEAKKFYPKDLKIIEDSFNFLDDRDELTCIFTFGNSEPVTLNSNSLDLKQFIQELKDEHKFQEDEPINIIVQISKTNVKGNITIYDVDCFQQDIENLTSKEFLTVFNRAFANNNKILFRVQELEKKFNSSSIYFLPYNEKENKIFEISDRQLHIKKLNVVSHFDSSEKYKLSPVDFKILEESSKYQNLCNAFNLNAFVLSIVYLFDISSIDKNNLEYKLNGYKSFKGIVDISKLDVSKISTYYSIFNWVYKGGNLNDKIGLSRNIISLHFENKDKVYLNGNPFQSIQSSYKIYEKENIKQYIELRNKISDQLIDFNNRATKIVESFASGFQKSALALLSFYISTIVIRVLSKGDFTNVFTLDAMILSLAFLSGSFIYFFVSRWEIKSQRSRFVKSYTNLKSRYEDLLNPEDIKRILNEDIDFIDDLKFIDDKKKNYSFMWIGILIILLLASLFLHFVYNTHDFSNTEMYQTMCNFFK